MHALLCLLRDKRKVEAIYSLNALHSTPNGVCRYGELKRLVPYDISHKIFTQQLQELESYNVIKTH